VSQAVLLNLLLRNYLAYNLIEQAETLASKAVFPEAASNNQYCRYLYYMGRVQAVQLDYSDAHHKLLQAERKAPHEYACGFLEEVAKLSIIVQLLMGDVPERSVFNTPALRIPLTPYLSLTQAVRNGDIEDYAKVAQEYAPQFKADKNYTLVKRLQHNVLKTGLRKISLSYSRIALVDVASKLHIQGAAAAEYICAKAIRDGVIDAALDHENGWLVSREAADMYATEEPQKAFHRRIAFCLDVHNEAVKSMRYPPDAYKKQIADAGKDDGAIEKSIEEIIQEMEDDEGDF
jgi:26S proteasome regulatory subunit N3